MDLLSLLRARAFAADGRARALREALGFSQADIAAEIEQVAARAGHANVKCSSYCVSMWERGLRRPSGQRGAAYGALLGQFEHAFDPS
jgi:transcriptional regulator with XRE-family HTH domain